MILGIRSVLLAILFSISSKIQNGKLQLQEQLIAHLISVVEFVVHKPSDDARFPDGLISEKH